MYTSVIAMRKSISELAAKDVMSTGIVSVEKTDTLNRVLPILINKGIHNVPVFDGKAFLGFFGYKELARLYRRPIAQTQVGHYIVKPPQIPPSTSIIDVADYMYRLNYKVLPVVENGTLAGIITERDLLRSAIDSGELNNKRVEEFMTPEPLSVKETDSMGTAFSAIRESNISRLPVVNAEGKLVGILKSFDMMKEIFNRNIDYGLSIDRGVGNGMRGSVSSSSRAHEELSDSKIPVKAIMNDEPATAKIGDFVESAFKDALNRNIISVIITDNKSRPIGIVVPKDIVSYIAKQKKADSIHMQISGLENQETLSAFEKEQVRRMIDEAAKKLAAIEKLQFFTMHYKSYHTENPKKSKYCVRAKADTDNGVYSVREHGWDIIDATSRLLEALEDMIVSKKQKIKSKMMEKQRYGKWLKRGGA